MKPSSKVVRNLVATCCSLLTVSAAHGAVVIESFESGTLNGWTAGTLNGSTTTVTTDRATDGIHSAANTFTVPAGFSGWTMNTIAQIDPRTIMDASATTLTVDVYSEWANPNGWGVYGNSINLVFNYEGNWTNIGPTSGALANGSFQTLTYDLTPYAATITNPGLAYSDLGLAWFVGTWAGGGDALDNGTQSFAIDNITVTSVPEPSSAVLLGICGMALALRRKR